MTDFTPITVNNEIPIQGYFKRYTVVYLSGDMFKKPKGFEEYKFIDTEKSPSFVGKIALWIVNFLYKHEMLGGNQRVC